MKVKELAKVLAGGGKEFRLDLYYNDNQLIGNWTVYGDAEVLFVRGYHIAVENDIIEDNGFKFYHHILILELQIDDVRARAKSDILELWR